MKKSYITPSTNQYPVVCFSALLTASIEGEMVLGDGGKVSQQTGTVESDVKSYSVWNDDWSK